MTETRRRQVLWIAMVAAVVVTAVGSAFAVLVATAAADLNPPDGDRSPGTAGARHSVTVAVPPLVPGDAATRCVEVLDSDSAGVVRVHGIADGELVEHLSLSVGRGGSGRPCDRPGPLVDVYDGPLDRFGGDYAAGHDADVTLGAGPAVPYLLTVRLDEHAPNRAQGETASLEVTWEVRPAGHPG